MDGSKKKKKKKKSDEVRSEGKVGRMRESYRESERAREKSTAKDRWKMKGQERKGREVKDRWTRMGWGNIKRTRVIRLFEVVRGSKCCVSSTL